MSYEHLITPRARKKLAALRSALRAHLATRGLAVLVMAVVAAVFLTLGVDYLLRMTRAQRGLIDALVLAALGYLVWRLIFRPLGVSMGSQDLALVLEKHYPQLDDRLISTLQFAQSQTSRVGASEELIGLVARQADELSETIDPKAPVQTRPTWRRLGGAGLAVGLLLAFTVLNPAVMDLWFQRNVLLADVDWPRQTYLTVQGGPDFKVVRGSRLEIVATADAEHVVPGSVTFHLKFPGLGTVPEAVPPSGPGANSFVKTIENVSDAFDFYVTGNDDRTPTCHVTTVDPPELVSIVFTIMEPEYMHPSPEGRSVTAAHGVLAVPAGSRIVAVGLANKDLASARLILDGQPAGSVEVTAAKAPDDPDGAQRPRGIQARLMLPERPQKPALLMQFELTDSENIVNRRGAVYSLRIEQDRAPGVTMTRTGVRGDVTRQATIPLILDLRDDHGVASAGVGVATTTRTANTATTQPAKLANAGSQEIRTEHALELAPLKLTLGEIVRVHAVASDTMPPSFGGPNVGTGAPQTFKIVSDEEIMEELIRREKEIRTDFARTVEMQAAVRDKLRAVRDRLADDKQLDAETRREFTAAAGDQRRVAGQCGVALQQLQAVLDEMVCNKVGGTAEQGRLRDRIITPLGEVSRKPMTDIAAATDQASKKTDADRALTAAGDLAGLTDELCRKLEDILKEMKDLESRQELANQLKRIIDVSQGLLEGMRKAAAGEGGSIFERTTQPGGGAEP